MTEASGWSRAAARAFGGPDTDGIAESLKCPMCAGSGFESDEYGMSCGGCGGSGLAPSRSPAPPTSNGQPSSTLLIVDRFDLTMIDVGAAGARLLVKPVSRPEAMMLAHEGHGIPIALNERGQGMMERELQLEPSPRPMVGPGGRLLVMQYVNWKDVRWFLVNYESDGDGCIA